MALADLFAQEQAVDRLIRANAAGRVAHAYLFTGPAGVGKTDAALAFARALNCRDGSGDACECCPSCRKAAAGAHPDIHLVAPAGSTLKIEQMRELQKTAWLSPLEGRYKAFIVRDADRMTPEAANSLLKILEEPPGQAVFILVSSAPYALLPTIVSRCQQVPFFPASPDRLARHLVDRLGLDPARARLLAYLSGGCTGRALALAEAAGLETRREQAWQIISRAERDLPAALAQAEQLEKQGDPQETLDLVAIILRDILLVKCGGGELIVNLDKGEALAELAAGMDLPALVKAVGAVEEAKRSLQRWANPRLVLEVLLTRLQAS